MRTKTICLGTMLIAVALMLMPTISAVETTDMKTMDKKEIINYLKNTSPEKLKESLLEKLKLSNSGTDGIITILIQLLFPLIGAAVFVIGMLIFIII